MSPVDLPPRRRPPVPVPEWLGELLCRAGFHDFEVLDVSFGFGPGETIEKIRCRRCQLTTARRAPR